MKKNVFAIITLSLLSLNALYANILLCPNGAPLQKGMTLEKVKNLCQNKSSLQAQPTIERWTKKTTYTSKYSSQIYLYLFTRNEKDFSTKTIQHLSPNQKSSNKIKNYQQVKLKVVKNHLAGIEFSKTNQDAIHLCGKTLFLNMPIDKLGEICGGPSTVTTKTPTKTIDHHYATLTISGEKDKLYSYHFSNNKLVNSDSSTR